MQHKTQIATILALTAFATTAEGAPPLDRNVIDVCVAMTQPDQIRREYHRDYAELSRADICSKSTDGTYTTQYDQIDVGLEVIKVGGLDVGSVSESSLVKVCRDEFCSRNELRISRRESERVPRRIHRGNNEALACVREAVKAIGPGSAIRLSSRTAGGEDVIVTGSLDRNLIQDAALESVEAAGGLTCPSGPIEEFPLFSGNLVRKCKWKTPARTKGVVVFHTTAGSFDVDVRRVLPKPKNSVTITPLLQTTTTSEKSNGIVCTPAQTTVDLHEQGYNSSCGGNQFGYCAHNYTFTLRPSGDAYLRSPFIHCDDGGSGSCAWNQADRNVPAADGTGLRATVLSGSKSSKLGLCAEEIDRLSRVATKRGSKAVSKSGLTVVVVVPAGRNATLEVKWDTGDKSVVVPGDDGDGLEFVERARAGDIDLLSYRVTHPASVDDDAYTDTSSDDADFEPLWELDVPPVIVDGVFNLGD